MTQVPRTPKQPLLPSTRTVLLVEGDDEVRVVSAVDPHKPDRVVRDARGQSNLRNEADALSRDPQFPALRSVGLLLDAEDDPATATALARQALRLLGCPVDTHHAQVHEDAGRRWGFFLFPDGASPGALESLLRRAIDPTAPSAVCATAWAACAAAPRPNVAQADKAWLRVAAAAWPKVREGWPQLLGQPGGILLSHPTLTPLRDFLLHLG